MLFIPALPARNPAISIVRGEQIFTEAECHRIRQSADRQAWQEGPIGEEGPGMVQTRVRSVLQQALPIDPASGFPLVRIVTEVSRLNSGLWYFDLTGAVPDDPAQLMTYRSGTGDHYDWHIDVGEAKSASRKLGFTVQLSASHEYEGGDLEFHALSSDREAFRRKGIMLVFPAFWLHRVTPVTRGTRHVIVGWIHGPSFR
jgi:PKHD-type hydroxylase